MFSGQQLIESLSNSLASSLLVGNTTKIQKVNDALQEAFICHNDDMLQVKKKHIVLCAGIGNNAFIETMTASSKKIPTMQARSCLTLVLEGDLPDMSILLPGLKIFIAPQYHQRKIYWLYTYGVDLMITKEKKEIDAMRLKNQLHALFDFFPSLKKFDLNFYARRFKSEVQHSALKSWHCGYSKVCYF
ncbi:MAG: hypothetical protein K2W97_00545, partial [Chthoniobacterales bacterium]|nr:hypothetical protein [Chthoniobacterales bacterium]